MIGNIAKSLNYPWPQSQSVVIVQIFGNFHQRCISQKEGHKSIVVYFEGDCPWWSPPPSLFYMFPLQVDLVEQMSKSKRFLKQFIFTENHWRADRSLWILLLGFPIINPFLITKSSYQDILPIKSHFNIPSHTLWMNRDSVLQELMKKYLFPASFFVVGSFEYLSSGPLLEWLLPFEYSLSGFYFMVVWNISTQVLCLNDYLLLHSPTCAACRQEIRPVPDTGVLVRVRMTRLRQMKHYGAISGFWAGKNSGRTRLPHPVFLLPTLRDSTRRKGFEINIFVLDWLLFAFLGRRGGGAMLPLERQTFLQVFCFVCFKSCNLWPLSIEHWTFNCILENKSCFLSRTCNIAVVQKERTKIIRIWSSMIHYDPL